ncbi:hypothetical protein [[Phormidium] sp. ETS-05]|uniref:hypothetical protein n=1 Tax=[Phormidium] sp. ETS-05 TaxID=222819 RepID=UPI0018EEE4E9|nr:hypothetical protein [[Phormidium] sp. ETS-05]
MLGEGRSRLGKLQPFASLSSTVPSPQTPRPAQRQSSGGEWRMVRALAFDKVLYMKIFEKT